MQKPGERHFLTKQYCALGQHNQAEFYIQTNHHTAAACIWHKHQRHKHLINSWRTIKEEWRGLRKLSDIRIYGVCVLRKYKNTLKDLQPFPDLPFSNISWRPRVHVSGISIVQITFRKMLRVCSAMDQAWTSFQRKSTAHPTAPKWLQEKHIPRKRLATPQLTLHQFATSSSAFTKNNRKSRRLAGWSAVGSWTTMQIFI